MNNYLKICVVIYFFIFSSLLIYIVPPFESPDEPGHLYYINFVSERHSLPNQYKKESSVVGEGHQFPLYYIAGAIISSLFTSDKGIGIKAIMNKKHSWNGGSWFNLPVFKHLNNSIFITKNDMYAFYALRLFSALLGIINILYIFKLSHLFFKGSKWEIFPAFFIVALPQFVFISSMINNDCLANLFTTMSLYYLFKILKTPEQFKNYLLLSISFGLGLCIKKTILFIIPGFILIFLYLLYKNKKLAHKIVKYTFLSTIIVVVISGWVFIRNYYLYGELLGNHMEKSTLQYLVNEKSLFSSYFVNLFFPKLFVSFIAYFGWMTLRLPIGVYLFYTMIISGSLIGIFSYILKKQKEYINVLFSILFVFLCLLGIIIYNLTYSQYQGRFLFPSISLIGISFGIGLKTIIEKIHSERNRKILIGFIFISFLIIDIMSLIYLYLFYYTMGNYS